MDMLCYYRSDLGALHQGAYWLLDARFSEAEYEEESLYSRGFSREDIDVCLRDRLRLKASGAIEGDVALPTGVIVRVSLITRADYQSPD